MTEKFGAWCCLLKFTWEDGDELLPTDYVKVKRMNHIIQVIAVNSSCNGFGGIQRLSKTEYVNLETGEICEYKLNENRAQNVAGLKESFRKFRDLANNNFVGGNNELFITLTYAENMTDFKRLYQDFRKFWLRFKYTYGTDWDYLTAVEPQRRGAWHVHGLLRKNDGSNAFIRNEDLRELWGHGFVSIKSLSGVDNVGAYLSAYLTNAELDASDGSLMIEAINKQLEVRTTVVDGKEKHFIKGGRLHKYPSGMNFFRHSRGIVPPSVEEMRLSEVRKIVGDVTPNYSKTLLIEDGDSGHQLNKVTYIQYNLKRI